eukprot:scaffold4357_cov59-Attheya_sp.AAC.3
MAFRRGRQQTGIVAWHGIAWHGRHVAWHGIAWHGRRVAWHGMAVHGMDRFRLARYGIGTCWRYGEARFCMAWRDEVSSSVRRTASATCGKSTWWHGTRGVDVARQGSAWAAGEVRPNAVACAT